MFSFHCLPSKLKDKQKGKHKVAWKRSNASSSILEEGNAVVGKGDLE